MGNQASCCTQKKEAVPSEFHFNSPTAGSNNQFPGFSTIQNTSTDPTSGLRKQTYTDYSVIRTQQDLPDSNTQVSPKKKKKLVRKKPPPLTDLGSLQDCCSGSHDQAAHQTGDKDLENGTEYESYGIVDKKKGAQYWDSTDEDRNLSVRLSEKRGILKERVANVTYRGEDLSDTRAFQSRKDVIEAGIVAQKCGEDDDDDLEFEEDLEEPESPTQGGYIVRSQHNTFQGAMTNYERHCKSKSIYNEGLTEVFETPREEMENTERVNRPYDVHSGVNSRESARLQTKAFKGSKTDRSVPKRKVSSEHANYLGYTERRGRVQNTVNTMNTQEDEVQKTVSTVYEDAFSCSRHYNARKELENREKVELDTYASKPGNESARSVKQYPPKSHRTPVSARKQQIDIQELKKSLVKERSYSPAKSNERHFQEVELEEKHSARSKSREDPAKLLSGLYHTCQSVVPADQIDVSPVHDRGDADREGSMRSSFCGEDRKMFVSEILKNIQMKNNRERGHHRENAWIARAERENVPQSQSREEQRRESVQRDVQKLMESAFKPKNSLLESYLRQSRVGNKAFEKNSAMDWKENLERKSEYSHPFWVDDSRNRDSYRESAQQEQREEPRKSVNDTPGFKNDGLNKSWESYSVQERKDMLLTKRFMEVPITGFENK